MSHTRAKNRKKKPAARPAAAKAPETRPQAGSDRRLSPFYATGPARPLAAPGAKKASAEPAGGAMAKKVALSRRGDRYEKEADAVAEKVTRGAPAPEVSRLPAGGLEAQRQEDEAETETAAQAQETEEAEPVQEQHEGEEETAQALDREGEETQAAQAQEEKPETETAAQTWVQRQEEGGEGESGEGEPPAQEMAEEGKEEEGTQAKSEEGEEPVQQQIEEEEEEVQELSTRDEARERKKHAAGRAIQERGAGEPLSPGTRSTLEAGLGTDLSGVRVHRDGRARQAARDMGARAFTHKNHIWLGAGESASDTRLMAHEAAHVVQQGGATRRSPGRGSGGGARSVARPAVQRKPAAPAPSTGEVAPEELELLGLTELPESEPVATWIRGRKPRRGPVRVRFGQMAKGQVEMTADKKGRLKIRKKSAIPLQHELFRRLGDAAPELEPSLILEEGRKVSGYVGLKASKGLPSSKDLQKKLAQYPVLLSIPGFELPKLARSKSLSRIEAGHLEYGIEETPVSFGALLTGSISFHGRDDKITSFSGKLAVHAQGLAEGELELRRDTTGNVAGKAAVDLDLPAGFSGGVTVEWADDAVSGEGRVGYTGEKLSGNVTLRLMDKEKAAQLEEEKKAPPEGTDEPAAAPAEGRSKKGKKSKKKGKQEFVLFGEGDLTFAFTDWLNGTAHVIVDPEGHVTIIGKITPQKEFELFPQKDYEKQIFKVEPRLSYGLPVIGNIFIFANVSLSAFATVGPAKLYNIQVAGTYSTDPETLQSFSIQGTLNLSAAAGLKLRGEAGAGIEILDHDVKAGAGVNGLAGIRGYAEATPIIGYREKPAADGADKKGEFYIRGEVEIAAQPFLGLSGDLFIELDSPWWSPAPDKKWTWPLGGKEWPIGGSFGVGASVDYVFGSGTWPKVEMKEVDFSAEKFMSDLYRDKAQPKSGAAGEKKGAWKEKNQKALEPPPKEAAPAGGMKPGKAPEPPPAKPKKVAKKKGKKATPDARTAEGKTVKQLKKEAAKKGKKGQVEKKAKAKGKEVKPGADTQEREKERELRKRQAADVVAKAMAGGIRKSRLLALLERLKKKYHLEQATLDDADDVTLRNSPPVSMKGRRALAVESSSLAKVKEGGKEKEKYTKKSPTGDKQVGTFASSAPRAHTLLGVIKPHLRALGFTDLSALPTGIPDKAPKPDKVQAELWYKVPIAGVARDAAKTKVVGQLGNMESTAFGRGPKDYEGGHLIGHQFGGPEIFQNLVPQRGNSINRGLYAKIENFVDANLPERESRDTHVKMTVWAKYSAGGEVDLRALAEALVHVTGREVTKKTSLRSSSFTIDPSLQPHLKSGSVPAEIRTAFAEKGVHILESARLDTKKKRKRWSITEEDPTDTSSRRIHVILLEDGKLKVRQAKAEGYFLSKDIREAATGAKKGLKLPSRIPNTIEAEVEVDGVKDIKLPKVAAAGETKKGSTLTRGDYVIVPETGPKRRVSDDKALKEAVKEVEPPKKVKVRTRFTLTGN